MPTDETRRVLKLLGVAVTTYEDAIRDGAPRDEISRVATSSSCCSKAAPNSNMTRIRLLGIKIFNFILVIGGRCSEIRSYLIN